MPADNQKSILEVLLNTFCCMMCVDGQVSPKERQTIAAILHKAKAPWPADQINTRIDRFIQRLRQEDLSQIIDQTCQDLARFREDAAKGRAVLHCLEFLMAVDGQVDDREKVLCQRFKSALSPLSESGPAQKAGQDPSAGAGPANGPAGPTVDCPECGRAISLGVIRGYQDLCKLVRCPDCGGVFRIWIDPGRGRLFLGK